MLTGRGNNTGRNNNRAPRLSPTELNNIEEWKAFGHAKPQPEDQLAQKSLALGCPSNTLAVDNIEAGYPRIAL